MAPENVQQKIVQGRIFSEQPAGKAKLKMKTIRTRNSAQLMKKERSGVGINDVCVPNLLWLKQAHLFGRGIFILRPSVTTMLSGSTNLYFSLKGHVHYVCVCVCVRKISCNCACRGFVSDNFFCVTDCCII
jgi:hypothetical protein